MPNGNSLPPQAAAAQAPQSYSAEEVEARLNEERKVFQRRLVKEQQARREAEQFALDNRRQLQQMESRFQGFQQQLESIQGNRRGSAPDDDGDIDYDNLTGKELRQAILREVRSSQSQPQGNAAEEEIWAFRLEKLEDKLRSRYQGISEEQLRRVLNTAYDSGVGDLEYVAHKVLGPAESFKPDPQDDNDLDDLQDEARARNRANVLAGRAALASAQSGPKTVQLRRHQAGHADAEKAANEWAAGRSQGR